MTSLEDRWMVIPPNACVLLRQALPWSCFHTMPDITNHDSNIEDPKEILSGTLFQVTLLSDIKSTCFSLILQTEMLFLTNLYSPN